MQQHAVLAAELDELLAGTVQQRPGRGELEADAVELGLDVGAHPSTITAPARRPGVMG